MEMNISKQTMTINGVTFTWDVPVQETKIKEKLQKEYGQKEKNKKKMGRRRSR